MFIGDEGYFCNCFVIVIFYTLIDIPTNEYNDIVQSLIVKGSSGLYVHMSTDTKDMNSGM